MKQADFGYAWVSVDQQAVFQGIGVR